MSSGPLVVLSRVQKDDTGWRVELVNQFPLSLGGRGLALPGGVTIHELRHGELMVEVGDPSLVWKDAVATPEQPAGSSAERSIERLGEVFELSTDEGTLEVVAFQANEAMEDRSWPGAVMEAIEAVRANDTPQARSVLADTLEEMGDFAAAEYVRLEQALQGVAQFGEDFVEQVRKLRSLGAVTGPTFRYLVGRDIEGCAGVRWSFRCPKRWDSMQATSDASERVCQSCRQIVTHVEDGAEAEAERLAGEGGCVSIQTPEETWEGEVAAEPEDEPGSLIDSTRVTPLDVPAVGVARAADVQMQRGRRPNGVVGSVAMPRPVRREPVVAARELPPAPWWKRLFGGTKR